MESSCRSITWIRCVILFACLIKEARQQVVIPDEVGYTRVSTSNESPWNTQPKNGYPGEWTIENDIYLHPVVDLLVTIVIQFIGVIIIYACIRCCCPTALSRTRPGFIFSETMTVGVPQIQPMPVPYPPIPVKVEYTSQPSAI